jgi:hypothetical protein
LDPLEVNDPIGNFARLTKASHWTEPRIAKTRQALDLKDKPVIESYPFVREIFLHFFSVFLSVAWLVMDVMEGIEIKVASRLQFVRRLFPL